MSTEHDFEYNLFLGHSPRNKEAVRENANRLKSNIVQFWFDEWEIRLADSNLAKIEGIQEHSHVRRHMIPCVCVLDVRETFGSDWAQLKNHTLRLREPLHLYRRFMPHRR